MATSGIENSSEEYLDCDSDRISKKAEAYCKTCDGCLRGPCQKNPNDKHKVHKVVGCSPAPLQNGVSAKCVVEIKRGSIVDYEADVIVSSVRKDLSLKAAVASNAIYRAAGKEMQNELNASYPSGIDFWQIVWSNPHGLKRKKCKMVLHGLLDSYRSRDSLIRLKKFVKMCLTMATDKGYESIAFPALGTGALRYPKSDVAKAMFSGVEQFEKEPRGKYFKKVLFVIYDKEAEQAFQEARKDYPQFG